MGRTTRLGVCAGVAAMLGVGAAADDPAVKFPADGALRYRWKSTRKVTTGAGAKATGPVETLEAVLEMAGTGGDGGAARARIRELAWKVTGAKSDCAFDAKKPPDEKAVAMDLRLGVLLGLVGDGFGLAAAPGTAAAISGAEDLPARAAARGTLVTPAKAAIAISDVREWIEAHLGPGGLVDAWVSPPAGATGTAAWTRTVEGEVEGTPATTEWRMKCATAADGKATITCAGSVTLVGEDEKPLPAKGTVTGTITLDTRAGRLLTAKLQLGAKLPGGAAWSHATELAFVEALTSAQVAPETYEAPLPAGVTCLERRVAKAATPRDPVPVAWEDDPDNARAQVASGDPLRVLERKTVEGVVRLRVVTARGVEGWVPESATEPAK